MKYVVAGVCAALAIACVKASAAEPTSAVVSVMWDVSLDVDGHVTDLSTRDDRIPKLHAYLENAIRVWRFGPGKVNGKPALTQTHLHTKLDVRLVADAVEIRLLSAATGGTYGKTIAPQYPHSAALGGKQGLVMLRVHYDETGAVKNVAPYGDNSKVDGRLVRAAIASASKWTFLPEIVGGHPIAGDSAVPICFHLGELGGLDCNWQDPTTGKSTDGTQSLALNPAATLESDVIGRVL
jgi:TonB family protein